MGLAVAASAASAAQPGHRNTGYCFGPDDAAGAPFRVFRYPSRPPLTDADVGYRWYPITDSTGGSFLPSRATKVRMNYFLWANSCDYQPGVNACHQFPPAVYAKRGYGIGNPAPKPQVVDEGTGARELFAFDSFAKANACTLAQASFLLGYPDARTLALARNAGLGIVFDRATLSRLRPDANLVYHNVCVMAEQRLPPRIRGMMLDYEVHDGRTPQIARDFLRAFAALVHGAGKEATLYTNPLDASGQKLSALDASNLNAIQAAFDMTTILLYRRDASVDFALDYARQRRLLDGPLPVKPPAITFDLARSTQEDARVTRNLLVANRLPAVIVFTKTAVLEGACDTDANRKLACLVQGRCGGGPG